jgi:hypothetical protein
MAVKYIITERGQQDMEICPIIYDNDVWLYDNIVRKRDVEALGRSKVKYENVYKLSVISRRGDSFR